MFSLTSLGFDPKQIKGFIIFALFFAVTVVAIKFALYLLKAIGIYSMSRKVRYTNKWYSFVPFMESYAFGRLADFKSGKKVFSLLLFIFNCFSSFFITASSLLALVFSVDVIFDIDAALLADNKVDKSVLSSLYIPAFLFIVGAVALLVYIIVWYISIWNIFSIFVKEKAVVYLVLSIIFPFIAPILLFVIRNNEPLQATSINLNE